MKKNKIITRMYEVGAMAIVRTNDFDRAVEIAQGCIDGGVPVLEMSYTLNSAGDMIKGLKEKFGNELLVGAGTVLDSETARHAILNDADFIIAPNYNEYVSFLCNRYQIPYAPGCSTLSESIDALTTGASFIKAFPISDFYGPKLVSVFKTPVPQMPIMASGGINLENLHEYVNNGVEICGFGGLLTSGTKEDITYNANQIRTIIDDNRK